MVPYEGGKVYGPYIRLEDDRSHVVIVFPDKTRRTVSYPKYLMEIKLGQYLERNEEVHHKDEDVTNEDPDNLVVINGTTHRKLHNPVDPPTILICAWCGIEFEVDKNHYRNRQRNHISSGPFCSKQCSGFVNN